MTDRVEPIWSSSSDPLPGKAPSSWKNTPLSEVLPISYGKSLVERLRTEGGAIPVYGSSGVVGFHSRPLLPGPALIVGRKGTVGAIYLSQGPCWPIDTTYYVESTPSTNLNFFYYLLKSMNLGSLDRSTAIPGLSRSDYDELNAVLPPSQNNTASSPKSRSSSPASTPLSPPSSAPKPTSNATAPASSKPPARAA